MECQRCRASCEVFGDVEVELLRMCVEVNVTKHDWSSLSLWALETRSILTVECRTITSI